MPKLTDSKAPFQFRVVKLMLESLEMKPARIARALNISQSTISLYKKFRSYDEYSEWNCNRTKTPKSSIFKVLWFIKNI